MKINFNETVNSSVCWIFHSKIEGDIKLSVAFYLVHDNEETGEFSVYKFKKEVKSNGDASRIARELTAKGEIDKTEWKKLSAKDAKAVYSKMSHVTIC